MTITLITIGKTELQEISSLVKIYARRLQHYTQWKTIYLPNIKNTKNLSENEQKQKEGVLLLKNIQKSDCVFLLDEKGVSFTSTEFATFLQKKRNAAIKNLVFIIGGSYGFSKEIYEKAQGSLSLSKMTFPHQMVKLFFVEQLYRAFSILNHHPYHHP